MWKFSEQLNYQAGILIYSQKLNFTQTPWQRLQANLQSSKRRTKYKGLDVTEGVLYTTHEIEGSVLVKAHSSNPNEFGSGELFVQDTVFTKKLAPYPTVNEEYSIIITHPLDLAVQSTSIIPNQELASNYARLYFQDGSLKSFYNGQIKVYGGNGGAENLEYHYTTDRNTILLTGIQFIEWFNWLPEISSGGWYKLQISFYYNLHMSDLIPSLGDIRFWLQLKVNNVVGFENQYTSISTDTITFFTTLIIQLNQGQNSINLLYKGLSYKYSLVIKDILIDLSHI